MSEVLMALGPHAFYMPRLNRDTFNHDALDRDSSYTWLAANRLSRDPAMQFVGPGEDVITIRGNLYPHHFGGLETLAKLHQAGRAGKPLNLIRFLPLLAEGDGAEGMVGVLLGKFVIRRVRKQESKIGTTGVGHKVEFSLELAKYGEDGDSSNVNLIGAVTPTEVT